MKGLTRLGSPPDRATALRKAARSTTAGTPVKSCINTRAGMNAMERVGAVRPSRERHDIRFRHVPAAGSARDVLEKDLDGVRKPRHIRSGLRGQFREAHVGRRP